MGAGQNSGQVSFECIGHADGARLYPSMCAARGYRGPAIDLLQARYGSPATALPLLERYLDVDKAPGRTSMPGALRPSLMPVLERAAAEAGAYLRGHLGRKINA